MSNINYLSINENFPVAGQDNDTQVFRDNFDTIKTSLRLAKEEITNIQDFGARLDTDNDFGSYTLQKAVLQNTSDSYADLSTAQAAYREIDFTVGAYQTLTVDQDLDLSFTQFPGDPNATQTVGAGVGKVTVELYLTGSTPYTVSITTSGGTVIKSNGFPDMNGSVPEINLTTNNVTNPFIFEVWRHSEDVIFMKYLGVFE